MGMFIKPIFYFAVRKFVCTPGATTNIYGCKYRIQGKFSKNQGKCSNHFVSLILDLSGKPFLELRKLDTNPSNFLGGRPKKDLKEFVWSFLSINELRSQRQFAPKCSFLASRPLGHWSFRIS